MAGVMDMFGAEERRRQVMLAGLLAGLVLTTVPVRTERALFSPLSDLPEIGAFSPVAYAVTFGFPDAPAGFVPGGLVPGTVGERPPTAFALRTPGEPILPGTLAPPGLIGAPPIAPGLIPTQFVPAAPVQTPAGNFGAPPASGFPGGNIPDAGTTPGGGTPPNTGTPPDGSTPPDGNTPPDASIPPINNPGPTPPGNPSPGPVPEPATWLTMILGFAVIGSAMRRRSRSQEARESAPSAG